MVSENHISRTRGVSTKSDIDVKVSLITDWISNGIPWLRASDGSYVLDSVGEKMLVAFPSDIKSFAEWNGPVPWSEAKGGTDATLAPVARSTISQKTSEYQLLRAELKKLFKDLEARAISQVERANKVSIIAGLQSEIDFKEKVIRQQEQDVIRLRREADAAKKALGDEQDERHRESEEFNRHISELEATKAELLAALSKVSPLRKAPK